MKRPSEAAFGVALRASVSGIVAYKPPDDARLWKPCDYMAWWHVEHLVRSFDDNGLRAAWFEVKDTDAAATWPTNDLRPSQRQGIATARDLGLPYYVAVFWRRTSTWTVIDANLIPAAGSLTLNEMATRGLASTGGRLAESLRALLSGR